MVRFKKQLAVALLAAVALLGGTAPAQAAFTLTFDDIINTVSTATIPNGYGGFNWNQFAVIHKNLAPNSGYNRGTVSGNYVAFNTFANVATTSGNPFTFNSAYLTAAWNTGLNIRVEGLVGNTVVYNQTVVVNTTGPTLFTFNYENITTVRFTSFGGVDVPGDDGQGTHFAMDNATFNDVTAVPVPPALALVATGLASLAGYGWTRRRKASPVS